MQQQSAGRSLLKATLETLAIAGPILCAIHCLALPVLIAALPLIGLQHLYHGFDEQLLTVAMLVICIPVFVPGFIQHRKKRVLIMMLAAFALILIANFAEAYIDPTMHTVVAVFGSALLLKANFDNRRFSKGHACCNVSHDHGSEAGDAV